MTELRLRFEDKHNKIIRKVMYEQDISSKEKAILWIIEQHG